MKKSVKIMFFIALVAIATLVMSCVSSSGSEQAVTQHMDSESILVDGGSISGIYSADGKVKIFKGIPFAAPPVGDLRWKAPQPVIAWDGVKECDDYSNYAFQKPLAPYGPYTAEFKPDSEKIPSEDCLYLNVWTKNEKMSEKLPVVVFIHGGGNTSGTSGSFVYEGENLARKDVVFVSINYRLGLFGFLAHPELSAESEDGISGNYAILDQIAALNWIQNNIEKFGGDPDNVTLVGQSAGSMDIQYLISSPMAKGLFDNAVTMSANVILDSLPPLAVKEEETVNLLSGKTIEELRAMEPEELLKIRYNAVPVLDGKVLDRDLLDSYTEGTAGDVNLMTGMVIQDSVLFPFLPKIGVKKFWLPMTSISKEDYISVVEQTLGPLAEEALALYAPKSSECIDQYNEMNQDYTMALQSFVGTVREIKYQKSTFIYKFTQLMPGPEASLNGVFHTSDVPYWLNNFSPVKADYWAGIDYKIGDIMSSYLVNFAKTGNPNGAGLPEWDSFNSEEISYLKIGDPITTVKFSIEKYNFWKEYLSTAGL